MREVLRIIKFGKAKELGFARALKFFGQPRFQMNLS